MTKTEAAEILANHITVQARRRGITQVTKDFIEEERSEAVHAGGQIAAAARLYPHWKTIRTAGRRNHNEK